MARPLSLKLSFLHDEEEEKEATDVHDHVGRCSKCRRGFVCSDSVSESSREASKRIVSKTLNAEGRK